jgi:hypothetical protein
LPLACRITDTGASGGEEERRNVRGRPVQQPSGRACGRRNPVGPGCGNTVVSRYFPVASAS